MEFTVEFYETDAGKRPVQEFLLKLKAIAPYVFAAVAAGLEKLRNRQYHREPLSKALGDGLFELRHVGKLNTRVLWFFMKGRRIVAVHGIRNKGPGHPGPRPRHRAGTDARLETEKSAMRKTNFDVFLEEQLRDPNFAERFKRAGEAWDVALQLAALRERAGLSQVELARKLRTTQQQISRLESPNYEGHSLSMLRRVARALNAHVRVIFESNKKVSTTRVAEQSPRYGAKRRARKSA